MYGDINSLSIIKTPNKTLRSKKVNTEFNVAVLILGQAVPRQWSTFAVPGQMSVLSGSTSNCNLTKP